MRPPGPVSRFRLNLVLGIILATGCSADPNAPFLNGQWGGTGLGVTSDQSGSEIRLACGMARLIGPLQFDDRGQINVRTTVDAFYFQYPARFQASLVRGYLHVTLTEFYESGDTEVERYVLTPGAEPDFSGDAS